MTFNAVLIYWAVFFSSAILTAAEPAAVEKNSVSHKPLNIVLIIGDDWGWPDFGFMGSRDVQTPNMDRLAAEARVFRNGYVPTSLCRSSLATLLSGRYPHQNKIFYNDPPSGQKREADYNSPMDLRASLPRVLASAGYRSFQTGKSWEGHYEKIGFTAGMTVKGRHGDEGLDIGRKTMQPIDDFIAAGKEPFFVWYAPMLPHTPHNPSTELTAKYTQPGRDPAVAKYYAMCEWTDQTIGQLIDILRKRNCLDNTLIVFLNDNGWRQIPNWTPQKLPQARAKNTPYDMGLRTPILFWRPGRVPAKMSDRPIQSIDLFPTMLAVAGAKLPAGEQPLPGLNLWPDLQSGEEPIERNVFGELYSHSAVDINRPEASLLHRWVRAGDWKLIVPHGEGATQLFNLKDDPDELKNLAANNREIVTRLRTALDGWWQPAAAK